MMKSVPSTITNNQNHRIIETNHCVALLQQQCGKNETQRQSCLVVYQDGNNLALLKCSAYFYNMWLIAQIEWTQNLKQFHL